MEILEIITVAAVATFFIGGFQLVASLYAEGVLNLLQEENTCPQKDET